MLLNMLWRWQLLPANGSPALTVPHRHYTGSSTRAVSLAAANFRELLFCFSRGFLAAANSRELRFGRLQKAPHLSRYCSTRMALDGTPRTPSSWRLPSLNFHFCSLQESTSVTQMASEAAPRTRSSWHLPFLGRSAFASARAPARRYASRRRPRAAYPVPNSMTSAAA